MESLTENITRCIWATCLMNGVPVYPMGNSVSRKWQDDAYKYQRKENKALPFPCTMKENGKPLYPCLVDEFIKDNYAVERDSWWNYYGGRAVVDKSLIIDLIESLKTSKIDWENMEEVVDDIEREFDGTDNPSTPIPIMKGVLKFTNGDKYAWVANLQLNMDSLKDVLAAVKRWEKLSDKEIVAEIINRFETALTIKEQHRMEYALTKGMNFYD